MVEELRDQGRDAQFLRQFLDLFFDPIANRPLELHHSILATFSDLKLQEDVARRNVRGYRQRVNYQRYEAKSDRAANDLSR